MQSVYFGKENNPVVLNDNTASPLPLFKKGPSEIRPREYYFPDEKNGKIKAVSFFSSFFSTFFLDILVILFGIPVLFFILYDVMPFLHFVRNVLVFLEAVSIIYIFCSLVFFLLLHNLYRRKVYVNDNGTFYILHLPVRVKNRKKGMTAPVAYADQRIHSRYARYIRRIDRAIDKKSLRVRKVLTDCRESDNLHDNGKYYTGFNEKKVREEEFRIPSYYSKYDPSASYYESGTLRNISLILLKLAFYGLLIGALIASTGKQYNIYNQNIDSYIESKIALLAPYGLEYRESNTVYDHSYEYLEFIDTANLRLNNSVRIYFDVTDEGIVDDHISIFYDMYYEYDPEIIKRVIQELYKGKLPDMSVIDETIREYLENPIAERSKTLTDDHTYFSLSVDESYWADYSIYVYVSKLG